MKNPDTRAARALKLINIVNLREQAEKLAIAKWSRSDNEFLPKAVSILETPPSPIHIAFIWTICLLATIALTWAYCGKIDIIAIAQGKIQPAGRVKTIQPAEPGRVIAIDVQNGSHVAAGDVLVELDPAEAKADENATSSAYFAFLGERARRRAALAAVAHATFKNDPPVEWPLELPASIKIREARVLKGDMQQLSSALSAVDAQITQKKEERKRLEDTIVSQEMLIKTLQERVTMRKGLLARGSTPKAAVIDAVEALQNQETNLTIQKGQLLEARAAVEVLASERRKTIDTFVADNEQKLGDVERQIDDFEQKKAKAHVKTGHMTIRSPISGTVLGLTVTTRNQVVSAGEELMRIVPESSELEIECYVENKDIGFVKKDQPAIVKIESFPFTRFGTLDATVIHVAHDAIPQPDAQALEGNPAKSQKNSFSGGAQRTQNLVFPVTLRATRVTMDIEGVAVPLSPGMGVSVEIKTGKRRIIDYFLSPLVEVASRSLRER